MRPRLLAVAFVGVALAACSSAVTPTPIASQAASASAVQSYSCTSRTVSWDGASAIDLTGTWAGDDEGVYYLRQLGKQVWWLGMSGLGEPLALRGTDWTNVYVGTLAGDTITGTYADVPQGQVLLNGPVVMKLTPTTGGGISLVRTTPDSDTPFGGKVFSPCKLN